MYPLLDARAFMEEAVTRTSVNLIIAKSVVVVVVVIIIILRQDFTVLRQDDPLAICSLLLLLY